MFAIIVESPLSHYRTHEEKWYFSDRLSGKKTTFLFQNNDYVEVSMKLRKILEASPKTI